MCRKCKEIIATKEIPMKCIAEKMCISIESLRARLNGKVPNMPFEDLVSLRDIIAPEMSIEELFPELVEKALRGFAGSIV